MTSNSDAKELFDSLTLNYNHLSKPIGEISKSDSGERFVEMEFNCIHLDKMPFMLNDKDEVKNCLCSDTIIFDERRDIIYLIEFKTGWPKRERNKEIRFKCYESIGKLLKYWSIFLNKNRKDFFSLKIKYCLITRGSIKQDITHPSFLKALNNSHGFFKLKTLDQTIVDETRVIVDQIDIFKFLSRITECDVMEYHNKNRTDYTVWNYRFDGTPCPTFKCI